MFSLLNKLNSAQWLAILFFSVILLLLVSALFVYLDPVRRRLSLSSGKNGPKRRTYSGGLKKFRIVWAVIFAVLLIAFAIGSVIVRKMLAEYESVQPIHKAEEIFNEYFAGCELEKFREFITFGKTDFESEEAAIDNLKSAIAENGGQAAFHEVISDDSSVHKYAVTVGDYVLGSFTVCTDEEKVTPKYHYRLSKTGKITVPVTPVKAIVIFAPKVAEVYVNDVLLTEDYREGEPVMLGDAEYFPDSDDSWRMMVNYVVKNLYAQPQIRVEYPGEMKYAVITDEETGEYHVEPCAPGNVPTEIAYTYSRESSAYTTESAYLHMLANAYNAAIDAEATERFEENLKIETERRVSEEKKDYDLLVAAEEKRIEEAIAFEISEGIRKQYGERVKLLTQKYAYFIYQSPTDSYRTATLAYTEKGSTLYNYVRSGYTNLSYFYPKTYTYGEFSSSHYVWTDDSHKAFTCEVCLPVDIYGQRNGNYYTINETVNVKLTVSFAKDKKGLLTNSENIIPE